MTSQKNPKKKPLLKTARAMGIEHKKAPTEKTARAT
jgi:hypothetical protein